jgi:hypothetical protein
VQANDPATVTHRDHTAGGAARENLVALDVEHHRAVAMPDDVEDMDAFEPKSSSVRAHHGAPGPHTVGHVRVFYCQLLGRC